MDSDRFDDVEFKIVESPEPAPRRRRRGLAAVATVLVAGGLAAGASAIASSDEAAAPAAAKPKVFRTFDGDRSDRRGHECRRGDKRHGGRYDRRAAPDTALRY